MGKSPSSFKSLMVTLKSSVLPGISYCFWFTINLGKGSFNGFHLAFLNVAVLTPQVKELMFGFCHLLSVSILNTYFGVRKITTGYGWGPLSSLWGRHHLKLHWSSDHYKPLLWLVNHSDIRGCEKLVSVQNQGLVVSEMSKYVLFPNAQLP